MKIFWVQYSRTNGCDINEMGNDMKISEHDIIM